MAEFEFYGKYKNVRNAAWNTFLDFNITSLPVRVVRLARQLDIIILSYEDGKPIIDFWELGALCSINNGFTVLIGEQWYIFYNDALSPRTLIRFTIAHEIGHFLLGHELKTDLSPHTNFDEENLSKKRKSQIETEADMFALRLLAPACVLWALNITEARDIMNLCGICPKEAKKRAARMQILYKREKFLKDEREKKVFKQFKQFIEMEKLNCPTKKEKTGTLWGGKS